MPIQYDAYYKKLVHALQYNITPLSIPFVFFNKPMRDHLTLPLLFLKATLHLSFRLRSGFTLRNLYSKSFTENSTEVK